MTNKPQPLPKSPRRQGIEMALLLAGLSEFIDLIFKTPNDRHRDAVTSVMTDTDVFTMKDWVAQPDACEFCDDMAHNGPYPIDYAMDSHPNCRCEWWPTM